MTLTVPSIQELGEVHGTARGPGLGLVQVDEERGHHMVLAEGPKEPLAGFGVVMGHAEHMAWGAESISERAAASRSWPCSAADAAWAAGSTSKLSSSSYCCKSYLLGSIRSDKQNGAFSLYLSGAARCMQGKAAQISQRISRSSKPRGRSAWPHALAHHIRQMHRCTPARALLSTFAGAKQLLSVPESPQRCPRLGGRYPARRCWPWAPLHPLPGAGLATPG